MRKRGSLGAWENVGGREPPTVGAVQMVRKGGKGRLWGALWSSPIEMLCAWQLCCCPSWPGRHTSGRTGSVQVSEELGLGPSPWKAAMWKVLSPDSHSTFKFYFK
jgi:hypothetical protein